MATELARRATAWRARRTARMEIAGGAADGVVAVVAKVEAHVRERPALEMVRPVMPQVAAAKLERKVKTASRAVKRAKALQERKAMTEVHDVDAGVAEAAVDAAAVAEDLVGPELRPTPAARAR